MNLQSVYYWTSEHPFIDRFKTSTVWTALGPQGAMSQAVQVDANGYPVALPAGANTVSTQIDLDPSSAGTDRVYELTWSGTATISVLGTKVLSSAPGKIVFEYDNDDTWSRVDVSGLDPAHPLTGIHVVRQDQVALYDAGEIFNPAFLDKAETWSTLRFKDWNHVDGADQTAWTHQNTMDSASWSNGNGVPIAVEVALANQTHTGMWINMPAQADDDYVRQTLQYVHDHLDPGLTVKVEYSNEVWNWSYAQAQYALTQGDKLWGTDANHDGRIDPNDPAEHVGDGWMQFYGYRSAQIAAIAHQVFGDAPQRLETVLETQTAYQGLEQSIFNGVAKAQDGSVATLFNDWAVTTYFGNELDGATPADQAKVLAWARAGSAGMDAAFHELEYGGAGFSGEGSLATLAQSLAYQAAVAKAHGMQMVAYEGGAHLSAFAYDPSVQQEVSTFFEKLMDDPRMGDLYTKMAHVFANAGGTELDAYTDTSTPGIYGDWGILPSIYDQSSPRYDALAAIAGENSSGETRPPMAQTTLDHYTLDDSQIGVTFTGSGAFTAFGNDRDNIIVGGPAGGNALRGGGGNDTLTASAGDNYLQGNAGDDTIAVGWGAPASTGYNRVYGGADNDVITIMGAGHNAANGNLGNDIINDTGFGDNTLRGGQGNDTIDGGSGHSILMGDLGNDVIRVHGSTGEAASGPSQHIDLITGGDGADTFVFSAAGAGQAALFGGTVYYQEITDFQPGVDRFVLPTNPTSAGDLGTSPTIFGSVHDAEVFALSQLKAGGGSHLVEALSVGSTSNTFLMYAEPGNIPADQSQVAGLGIIHLDGVAPAQISYADL